MFARAGKYFIVLALVFSTGAHWAALQTVAWTTMLANNCCRTSFSEAVSKTFDGKHPCCLCKAIAAAKKSEKKSAAVSPVLKMEFPLLAGKMSFFPPTLFEILSPPEAFDDSLSFPPPLPPPRAFFA